MKTSQNLTIEKAPIIEQILLVWVIWAFLAVIANAISPVVGAIAIYPIALIASLFGDAQASIVGGFVSFGISIGLIVWGIEYSMRRRRNKKITGQPSL